MVGSRGLCIVESTLAAARRQQGRESRGLRQWLVVELCVRRPVNIVFVKLQVKKKLNELCLFFKSHQ